MKRVDDDGTVILDSYLVFEEDEEDSSPSPAQRKWKDGLGCVVGKFMVCWSMVPRFQRSMGLEMGRRAIR